MNLRDHLSEKVGGGTSPPHSPPLAPPLDNLDYDKVHNVLARLSDRVVYDSFEDTITGIPKQHIPIKEHSSLLNCK